MRWTLLTNNQFYLEIDLRDYVSQMSHLNLIQIEKKIETKVSLVDQYPQ